MRMMSRNMVIMAIETATGIKMEITETTMDPNTVTMEMAIEISLVIMETATVIHMEIIIISMVTDMGITEDNIQITATKMAIMGTKTIIIMGKMGINGIDINGVV